MCSLNKVMLLLVLLMMVICVVRSCLLGLELRCASSLCRNWVLLMLFVIVVICMVGSLLVWLWLFLVGKWLF